MEQEFFKKTFDYKVYEKNIVKAGKLTFPLGINEKGNLVNLDLHDIFHVAIAGTTGSGKSTFLYSTLYSLMKKNSPEEVKFVLVDTKKVTFFFMKNSNYLYKQLVNSGEEFGKCIKELLNETLRRYDLFDKLGVSNLEEFNSKSGVKKEPRIVVLVDEFADAYYENSDFMPDFIKLLQISKGAGITVMYATQVIDKQYYSNDLHTNSPTKILLSSSKETSNMLIKSPGGETLFGQGDMIFVKNINDKPSQQHLKGLYITSREVKNLLIK